MIALVAGVMAALTNSKFRFRVDKSISTKTGLAPTVRMTLAVDTQEMGVVITSSPGPIPATRSATSIVAVPLAKQRTGRPPKSSDRADSSCWHFGPVVIQPERRTSPTAAIVASSILGLVKGKKGS